VTPSGTAPTPPAVHTAIHTDQAALAELVAWVPESSVGAVVTFSGVVRDHDHGRAVVELEYEGHPSAAGVLERIAAGVVARHPAVLTLRVAHWIGPLRIGDTALYAEVGAAHRGEAFAACSDLVETVKRELPIWKRQLFEDGTEEWVNCP
jgi:molybdopterin synthase catalytic subunit